MRTLVFLPPLPPLKKRGVSLESYGVLAWGGGLPLPPSKLVFLGGVSLFRVPPPRSNPRPPKQTNNQKNKQTNKQTNNKQTNILVFFPSQQLPNTAVDDQTSTLLTRIFESNEDENTPASQGGPTAPRGIAMAGSWVAHFIFDIWIGVGALPSREGGPN